MQQAHRTAQLLTTDESEQERLLRAVARYVADTPPGDLSPAEYTTPIYRILAELSGVRDAYAETRDRQNRTALALLPHIEAAVRAHADPLTAAARVAAAGNLIDSGVGVPEDVERSLLAAIDQPFVRDESPRFFAQLRDNARSLLYICDNAGEIVFDRLFIQILKEHFPRLRVTAAVKGTPILNDATVDDARQSGLDRAADALITTGEGVVGVPLGRVSAEFRRALEQSDLFLSKGQGNYETLDEQPGGFLILAAKCQVVAEELGAREGDLVFVASRKAE